MDFTKLLDLAVRLNIPGAVADGIAFVNQVKEAAARSKDVLSHGEQAELDAIHAEALAASDRLDAKLADAEKR